MGGTVLVMVGSMGKSVISAAALYIAAWTLLETMVVAVAYNAAPDWSCLIFCKGGCWYDLAGMWGGNGGLGDWRGPPAVSKVAMVRGVAWGFSM